MLQICAGLFVPAVVQTVFLYPDSYGVANWKLWKNILLMIFALIALGTGSYASILDIVKMYS